MRRFKFDPRRDIVKCPRGKILRPGNPVAHGRFFYTRKRDCDGCSLASICFSKGRTSKALVISHDYPALLRARRRRDRWSVEEQRLYQRHRWRSEGFHGEAKTWHGLARAVRRGIHNMKIQAYPDRRSRQPQAAGSRSNCAVVALVGRIDPADRPAVCPQGVIFAPGSVPRKNPKNRAAKTKLFNSPTVHKHRNLLACSRMRPSDCMTRSPPTTPT